MIALLLWLSVAIGAPSGKRSDANSTSETLAAEGSFTGGWQQVYEYASIRIRVVSDTPGAFDAFMQFSEDCSTTDSNVKVASDSTNAYHALAPFAECYRLVVTDTSGVSNAIRAETYLLATAPPIAGTRVDSTLDRYSNAIATRPISDFDFDTSRGRLSGFSTLHKFGRNPDVGASEEHVDTAGGTFNAWLTAADNIRIKAGGDANDTAAGTGAQEVTCECLESFTATTYTDVAIATNGASVSASSTESCVRVPRCYVSMTGTYHGTNVAAITIETDAGVVMNTIPLGRGQTGEGSKGVDVYFWQAQGAGDVTTPFTAAPRLIQQFPGLSGCTHYEHKTLDPYPAGTDFWWTAQTVSGANTDVTVEYEILIEASD